MKEQGPAWDAFVSNVDESAHTTRDAESLPRRREVGLSYDDEV